MFPLDGTDSLLGLPLDTPGRRGQAPRPLDDPGLTDHLMGTWRPGTTRTLHGLDLALTKDQGTGVRSSDLFPQESRDSRFPVSLPNPNVGLLVLPNGVPSSWRASTLLATFIHFYFLASRGSSSWRPFTTFLAALVEFYFLTSGRSSPRRPFTTFLSSLVKFDLLSSGWSSPRRPFAALLSAFIHFDFLAGWATPWGSLTALFTALIQFDLLAGWASPRWSLTTLLAAFV